MTKIKKNSFYWVVEGSDHHFPDYESAKAYAEGVPWRWGFWGRYDATYGALFNKAHLFYNPSKSGSETACGRWPELMHGHTIIFWDLWESPHKPCKTCLKIWRQINP